MDGVKRNDIPDHDVEYSPNDRTIERKIHVHEGQRLGERASSELREVLIRKAAGSLKLLLSV